jgi:hypothetical protein
LYTCFFTAQELFSYMSFIHIFCNKSKKKHKNWINKTFPFWLLRKKPTVSVQLRQFSWLQISYKILWSDQTNSYFLYWTDVQCLVPRWKQPGLTHQTVRSLGISSRSICLFQAGKHGASRIGLVTSQYFITYLQPWKLSQL